MDGTASLAHCTAPNLRREIASLGQPAKKFRAAPGLDRHYHRLIPFVQLNDEQVRGIQALILEANSLDISPGERLVSNSTDKNSLNGLGRRDISHAFMFFSMRKIALQSTHQQRPLPAACRH